MHVRTERCRSPRPKMGQDCCGRMYGRSLCGGTHIVTALDSAWLWRTSHVYITSHILYCRNAQLHVSYPTSSLPAPATSTQLELPLRMTDLTKHHIATTHTEVVNMPTPSSDSQHVEQTSGSVQLYSSNGGLRLIPIPTDDPCDPLTWPTWKRYLVLTTLAVYGTAGFGGVQSTPLYFSLLIPQYLQQTRGVGLPHFLPTDCCLLKTR
jgi:hypothetical protein